MDLNKTISIKNRGAASVTYSVPDSNIRRSFTPNEIKRNVPIKELEMLAQTPGGLYIIKNYLLVSEEDVLDYLGIDIEPEYSYGEVEVKKLLLEGSLDQLADCLEFAPEGVLGLIKKISVEIELNDVRKRNLIKESKLAFDISAALAHIDFDKAKNDNTTKTGRRSAPINAIADTKKSGRRAAAVEVPTYNVVE